MALLTNRCKQNCLHEIFDFELALIVLIESSIFKNFLIFFITRTFVKIIVCLYEIFDLELVLIVLIESLIPKNFLNVFYNTNNLVKIIVCLHEIFDFEVFLIVRMESLICTKNRCREEMSS